MSCVRAMAVTKMRDGFRGSPGARGPRGPLRVVAQPPELPDVARDARLLQSAEPVRDVLHEHLDELQEQAPVASDLAEGALEVHGRLALIAHGASVRRDGGAPEHRRLPARGCASDTSTAGRSARRSHGPAVPRGPVDPCRPRLTARRARTVNLSSWTEH